MSAQPEVELELGPAEAEVVSLEAEEDHLEAVSVQSGVEQIFPDPELEHLEEVRVLQEEMVVAAEPEFMLSVRSRQRLYPMQLLVRFFSLVLHCLYWLIAGPHTTLFLEEW